MLRTQAGVGILTALCLIHTLGEVAPFSSSRQVVAFAGLCPLERNSGARVASAGSAVRGRRCCATCSGRRRTTAAEGQAAEAFYRRLARRKPGGWRKRPVTESFLSNSRSCCGRTSPHGSLTCVATTGDTRGETRSEMTVA
ncbi:MAG: transposase [Acidobacteria bacterium]|nr:transposase [Acidobacteriota bacterium]